MVEVIMCTEILDLMTRELLEYEDLLFDRYKKHFLLIIC